MINKIITGINAELEKEFGVGYQIYNESIEQGLEMPCFLITCLNPTNNHEFWVRYKSSVKLKTLNPKQCLPKPMRGKEID